jgi:hypothetical protein
MFTVACCNALHFFYYSQQYFVNSVAQSWQMPVAHALVSGRGKFKYLHHQNHIRIKTNIIWLVWLLLLDHGKVFFTSEMTLPKVKQTPL